MPVRLLVISQRHALKCLRSENIRYASGCFRRMTINIPDFHFRYARGDVDICAILLAIGFDFATGCASVYRLSSFRAYSSF